MGSVEEGEVVKFCPAGHALRKVEIEKFDKVIDFSSSQMMEDDDK